MGKYLSLLKLSSFFCEASSYYDIDLDRRGRFFKSIKNKHLSSEDLDKLYDLIQKDNSFEFAISSYINNNNVKIKDKASIGYSCSPDGCAPAPTIDSDKISESFLNFENDLGVSDWGSYHEYWLYSWITVSIEDAIKIMNSTVSSSAESIGKGIEGFEIKALNLANEYSEFLLDALEGEQAHNYTFQSMLAAKHKEIELLVGNRDFAIKLISDAIKNNRRTVAVYTKLVRTNSRFANLLLR